MVPHNVLRWTKQTIKFGSVSGLSNQNLAIVLIGFTTMYHVKPKEPHHFGSVSSLSNPNLAITRIGIGTMYYAEPNKPSNLAQYLVCQTKICQLPPMVSAQCTEMNRTNHQAWFSIWFVKQKFDNLPHWFYHSVPCRTQGTAWFWSSIWFGAPKPLLPLSSSSEDSFSWLLFFPPRPPFLSLQIKELLSDSCHLLLTEWQLKIKLSEMPIKKDARQKLVRASTWNSLSNGVQNHFGH